MHKCKVCGKDDLKNLMSHVRAAHGMGKEEYDNYEPVNEDEEVFEEMEDISEEENKEPVDEAYISHEKLQQNRFNVNSYTADKPLQSFLDEFRITEKELRAVVRQYKGEERRPLSQEIKENETAAASSAEEIVESYTRGEKVEAYDVWTAEALVKQHGFKCLKVVKAKGVNPKKWILTK